jgi:hypothetical protein
MGGPGVIMTATSVPTAGHGDIQLAEAAGVRPLTSADVVADPSNGAPWLVDKKTLGGVLYHTLQRIFQQEGGSDIKGPLIYLAPHSDNAPPFIYSPGTKSESEVLLIPTDFKTMQLNAKSNMVEKKRVKVKCEQPSYIAIPRQLKMMPGEIFINNERYIIHPIDITKTGSEDEINRYHQITTAILPNGITIKGFQVATHFSCLVDDSDRREEYLKRYFSEMEYPPKYCFIYDTSSSMALTQQTYLHHIAATSIDTFIHSLLQQDIHNLYKTKGEAVAWDVLKTMRASFLVYAANANAVTAQEEVVHIADFITPVGFQIDHAKIEEWLAQRVGRFEGGNGDSKTISSFITDNCPSSVHITDNFSSIPVRSPALIALQMNQYLNPRISFYPYNNDENALELAKREHLPLFITFMMLDDPKAGSPPHEKDSYFDMLSSSHYLDLYNGITDPQSDSHIRKRGIAILASWAVRGDAEAKQILLNIFDNADKLDVSEKAYLGKCVSLLLTDDEAKGIAKRILENPTSEKNTFYLIALGGHREFNDAVKFMLDTVWSHNLIINPSFGNIVAAFSAVFNDPIIQFNYPPSFDQQAIAELAGIKWDAEMLQRGFEILATEGLPALSKQTSLAESAIYSYAVAFLNPKWVRKDQLRLNPIPRERYWGTIPIRALEESMVEISKTADWEEGWDYFKAGDQEFTFESGLIQTSVSAVLSTDWGHIDNVLTEASANKDELIIIQYHIHPYGDVGLPSKMNVLPSPQDLLMIFYRLVGARRRYPTARVEFRIASPHGITKIIPSKKLIELADEAIKTSKETGVEVEIPRDVESNIELYDRYTWSKFDLYKVSQIKSDLSPYFEVEFPWAY